MTDKRAFFTCDHCGETYEKGRTDSEAAAEAIEVWGQLAMDDIATVCDDCFAKLGLDKGWDSTPESSAETEPKP